MNVLIIEDDFIIAETLSVYLEDYGFTIQGICDNYDDALEHLYDKTPDFALVDITLEGGNTGISIANEINLKLHIPFIIITSQTDEDILEKVISAKPYGIVHKPLNRASLYSSIKLALKLYNEQKKEVVLPESSHEYMFIKHNYSIQKIKVNDILYIQSDNIYIDIYLNTGKRFLIRTTLDKYKESLPSYFMRVHRRFVVNINHVDYFNYKELFLLNCKEPIPIGRKYKEYLYNLQGK